MIHTHREDEPDFKQFKRDIVKASIVMLCFTIIICAFFLSLKMGFWKPVGSLQRTVSKGETVSE